jgi:hypothetical protein
MRLALYAICVGAFVLVCGCADHAPVSDVATAEEPVRSEPAGIGAADSQADARIGDYLTRSEPILVRDETAGVWYEETIGFDVVEALMQGLARNGVQHPLIYRIPKVDQVYLIAAVCEDEQPDDYGLRFFLVRVSAGDIHILDRTRGAMDSYSLRPTLFTGEDRVLILAETGAEYSWGISAFEFAGDRLRSLGNINVARSVNEPIETTENPLPYAKTRHGGDAYVVEFYTDLVIDPGGDAVELRRDGDAPFVFVGRHGQFKLVSLEQVHELGIRQ